MYLGFLAKISAIIILCFCPSDKAYKSLSLKSYISTCFKEVDIRFSISDGSKFLREKESSS